MNEIKKNCRNIFQSLKNKCLREFHGLFRRIKTNINKQHSNKSLDENI